MPSAVGSSLEPRNKETNIMITKSDELKTRVEARQAELKAQLLRAKADSTAEASEAVEKIESKLRELSNTVQDGWDNLSDDATRRLNEWLD
jgi:hypothetical protein